jgi:predicted DNA-binding transcriptional regulator YafY
VLEAVDARSSIMHTGAQSLDHLCFWLAMIGIDFEVREPKELRDRVKQIAARFARACEESRN